jgi:hypothetical protein
MINPNRYWLRLLGFFLISLGLAVLALPSLLGALTLLGIMHAPCTGDGPNPADFGYAAEDVTISMSAEGGHFRAYFIPGRNGATIIVPPAVSHGRGSRWAETQLLLDHGYSILTFESRPCAGLGPFTLGYEEVEQVGAALAYLHSRPEVDPTRIGIHGFSSAGATAVMAAARLSEIQAVVAEGGYGNFAEDSLGLTQRGGPAGYVERAYRWPFRPLYRLAAGHRIEVLCPVCVIDQIAPRPVLLFYGSEEVSLPGARRQQAAGGETVALWVVEGAGHGNYLAVAPEAYERRLIEFFDGVLLSESD